MRLSFSAVSTFQACPRKYKIHYIDRIRPIRKKSPLSFGTAIDDSAENYLLNKDASEARKGALETFEKVMRHEHSTEDVEYSQSDIQLELVAPEKLDELVENSQLVIEDVKEFLKYCKENKLTLDGDELDLLKSIQIEAMVEKGKLMMPLFFDWVDENVETVHSCQRKIEISNDLGDTFIGFLDFEVTLKNGKRYIFDMKTSSNPNKYYPEESASESFQLGIYSQETDIPLVGYFVLDKKIRVREPRVRFKDVRGEVTEEHLDDIFEQIEETRVAINEGEFPKNLDSCFLFGRCQYFDYCKHNSMVNLCKKED